MAAANEEQGDSGPVPVRHRRAWASSWKRASPFISIGNDLHHVLTQAGAYVKDVEDIAKGKGKTWGAAPPQFCNPTKSIQCEGADYPYPLQTSSPPYLIP